MAGFYHCDDLYQIDLSDALQDGVATLLLPGGLRFVGSIRDLSELVQPAGQPLRGAGEVNWQTLIEQYLAQKPDWDEKTTGYYRNFLKQFAAFLAGLKIFRPAEIEVDHINGYLGALRRLGRSWSTRNGTFTAIRDFFTWMRRRKLIIYNPFRNPDSGLERPKKIRTVIKALAKVHIRTMIARVSADESLMARRDLAIMLLLSSTGMRRHEVTGLKVAEIDMNKDEFVVTGKGGHQRTAFLLGKAKLAMQMWLALRPPTEAETVFVSIHPNKKGLYQPLEPDAINDMLLRWRDRAGISDKVSVSPHKWRHAFATEVATNSGNPFALQALLGHINIETTAIYIEQSLKVLRQVAQTNALIDDGDES